MDLSEDIMCEVYIKTDMEGTESNEFKTLREVKIKGNLVFEGFIIINLEGMVSM